ncbi:hypothetical protein HRbin02_00683 [Candidatus Calditenuaceae archaeon HR02]|nr:hypothetical protein HRbin02_00683 [Candidatus Calditenuaceae archaeon HR02]
MSVMWRVIAVLVIWSFSSILSMTWGFRRDWPDLVHDAYGLPFTWAIHTLSTFTGPADFWSVDLTALMIDLAIWQAGLAVALLALLKLK